MKKIQPSKNKHQFPNKRVKSIECRKRDLVFRIADWTKDEDEPALDVETYVGGVYSFNLSKTFSIKGKTHNIVKTEIASFIASKLSELL